MCQKLVVGKGFSKFRMFLAKVIGNCKYFDTEMLPGMWYQIIPRYGGRETEEGRWIEGAGVSRREKDR